MNNIEVEVRPGTIADVPLLLSFIRSMAAFEKLTVSATEESLRASLFGEAPAAHSLLAVVNGTPIAYATYYFTFASMAGRRGLWLDDLFVDPAFRDKGVGKTLMAYLAEIARENQCARFEWMVLDWNESAIGFYKSLGADVLKEWRMCRLDETELLRVSRKLVAAEGTRENVIMSMTGMDAARPSSGSTMSYRNAAGADAPVLAQMNHQLIRDEGHRNRMSVSELEERMRRWLGGEYQAVLFEDEQGAVGYALYKWEPEWVYVRQFFVQPERRRQGIGRAAWAWLRENPWRESPRIRLDVLIGNASGIRFWRSLDFEDYCVTMEQASQS